MVFLASRDHATDLRDDVIRVETDMKDLQIQIDEMRAK